MEPQNRTCKSKTFCDKTSVSFQTENLLAPLYNSTLQYHAET